MAAQGHEATLELSSPVGEGPHKFRPKNSLLQTIHGELASAGGDSLSAVRIPQRKKQKKTATRQIISLKLGFWNVRTLHDRKGTDSPKRRMALVDRELDGYQVDMAALSETRLADVEAATHSFGLGKLQISNGRQGWGLPSRRV